MHLKTPAFEEIAYAFGNINSHNDDADSQVSIKTRNSLIC